MLEKYIPKRFATAMIKHVIAVTLFFPYFYTKNGNPAYADFVLANFFAILTMVFILTSWKLDFKRNAIFVTGLSILLVAYNVCATYMNVKYHHWYGEQINTTISFLLFIVLLLVKDIHALIDTSTIKATIHMIVASNVLALCFRAWNKYERVFFMNDWIELKIFDWNPSSYFEWLYGHKSEYGLVLVLCITFLSIHHSQFKNVFTYISSQGILFLALFFSGSYTSIISALLIFCGHFLDYLCKAKWWKKMLSLFIMLPFIAVAKEFWLLLENKRNLLTLGFRTYIWDVFTELIKENPNGMSGIFGVDNYNIPEWNYFAYTTNCHNIFLNHMFRFSIPVGGIFSALFVLITLICIKRFFCFSTIFIWIALFLPMTMDHSLTTMELTFFMLVTFILFFQNTPKYSFDISYNKSKN